MTWDAFSAFLASEEVPPSPPLVPPPPHRTPPQGGRAVGVACVLPAVTRQQLPPPGRNLALARPLVCHRGCLLRGGPRRRRAGEGRDPRSLEMTRDGPRWAEITRDDPRWTEITRDDARWTEMGRDRSRSLEIARDQAVTDNLFLYVNECKRNERRVRGAGGGGERRSTCRRACLAAPPQARAGHGRSRLPRVLRGEAIRERPRFRGCHGACPRPLVRGSLVRGSADRPRSSEFGRDQPRSASFCESLERRRRRVRRVSGILRGARRRSMCARPSSASSSTTPRSSGSPDLRPLAAWRDLG